MVFITENILRIVTYLPNISANYYAGDTLGELKLNQQWHRTGDCKKKLIIDKRIKFCIFAKLAHRLQKDH